MRAIPFRAVFVLGLGEGEFPAANRRDALDLRAAGRQAGDVTPAERDRYLFLETLLSAREHLVLSYVSRDERTGEELRPSSVVQELLEVLERTYVGAEGVAALHESVPVHRWDPSPLGTVAPGAGAEAAAAKLGRTLRSAAPELPADPLPALRRRLPEPAWRELSTFLRIPRISATASALDGRAAVGSGSAASVRALPLKRLRELLECPLQASARTLLGLERDEDEDAAAVEDEPLRSGPGTTTMLVRDAFARALRRNEDVRAAYAAVARPKTLAGELPQGVLGELERDLHLGRLDQWQAVVAELGLEGGERLRMGRAAEREDVDALLPAVRLTGADGAPLCDLHGRSELLLARRTVSVVGDLFGGNDEAVELAVRELRLTLRGFFDHLLLAATGALADAERRVLLLRPKGKGLRWVERRLLPVSSEQAQAYLSTLATDLLGGVHDYLLPCEAVLALHHKATDRTRPLDPAAIADDAVGRIGNTRQDCQSRFGPVPEPAAYAPPSPERIAEIVRRRWTPFFATLAGVREEQLEAVPA
jgi:exodeoxyribonuclease V gamma subunit